MAGVPFTAHFLIFRLIDLKNSSNLFGSVKYARERPSTTGPPPSAKQPESERVVNTISNKTYSAKPADIEKKWVLIDAEGKHLGRLCTEVATILKGKNKPQYTPHMDTGDHVVVINADKIVLTGNKMEKKEYFHYTGYPGGGRIRTAAAIMEKNPAELVLKAVKGMLPKNRLGRRLLTNVRVYAGSVHPHAAQQPATVEI